MCCRSLCAERSHLFGLLRLTLVGGSSPAGVGAATTHVAATAATRALVNETMAKKRIMLVRKDEVQVGGALADRKRGGKVNHCMALYVFRPASRPRS
jgi:hypothetical protein